MTWLSTNELEEMYSSQSKPSPRTWEREFMALGCHGPATAGGLHPMTDGLARHHLVPCVLDEYHEGECSPGSNPWLHHNCKKNGCLNPELMDRYMTEEMREDHRASG